MTEPVPLIEPDEDYGRRRIVANAKQVARERRIRWILRLIIVIGMAPFIFWLVAEGSGPEWLGLLVAIGILSTLVAGGILFMMGGLAPMSVRRRLSERERRLLDD